MSAPRLVRLPDGRAWLRVADPDWSDPLDPAHAAGAGGRWNPPHSFPTLYLNADPATGRMQLERLLAGWPVSLEDLDDDAYVLVATSLPDGQVCADAVSSEGLDALGLPATYPVDEHGALIGRDVCQPVGKAVKHAGLAGVWCISAGSRDGSGRELAWFPEPAGARARSLWREPLPLGAWRYVSSWSELGLPEQEAPVPVDPLPPQLP